MRYHPLQGMGCIIMKSSFSSFHIKTISRRFQKTPLRGPFSKTWAFVARKRRLRVDGRLKRRKKSAISRMFGYMRTGPWADIIFLSCDCPFNVIAKHTLLCSFSFCSLSCINCFFVILTSFFINFLLPRVLQIEIHNKLLITLYLMPSKSVAEELWFKFGPEALDFWSTNSIVRTTTVQHNEQYHNTEKYCSVAFIWMVTLEDFIGRLKS